MDCRNIFIAQDYVSGYLLNGIHKNEFAIDPNGSNLRRRPDS